MKSNQDILNIIHDRFPEMDDSLNMLFLKDENFHEICEDYVLCLSSMSKIIITNKKNDKILKEYKNALKELELEMLEYLNSASIL